MIVVFATYKQAWDVEDGDLFLLSIPDNVSITGYYPGE